MTWWLAVILAYIAFVAGLSVGGLMGNIKYEDRIVWLERQVEALEAKILETVKWRERV
jgi:cell division protein FtsB